MITIRLNRSRKCRLCDKRNRVQISSPKPDDPDYKVAVCPTCDQTACRIEGVR